MQMLKDAILERGKAINQDILLVDSFLNHQVDVALMKAVGETFAEHFANQGITRVVTIESSGIAPASFTALALGLPLVIMKKQTSRILNGDLLQTTVRSFTKGTEYQLSVKHEFLNADDNILLIDDFLASGEAAFGVITLAGGMQGYLMVRCFLWERVLLLAAGIALLYPEIYSDLAGLGVILFIGMLQYLRRGKALPEPDLNQA